MNLKPTCKEMLLLDLTAYFQNHSFSFSYLFLFRTNPNIKIVEFPKTNKSCFWSQCSLCIKWHNLSSGASKALLIKKWFRESNNTFPQTIMLFS